MKSEIAALRLAVEEYMNRYTDPDHYDETYADNMLAASTALLAAIERAEVGVVRINEFREVHPDLSTRIISQDERDRLIDVLNDRLTEKRGTLYFGEEEL